MGAKWIKISVIYFILGIAMGLFMSATLQLNWAAAHAHVNLIGWASTAIIGLVYTAYPRAGSSTLGKWQFWLYNLGLPILLISMILVQIQGLLEFAHILTFIGGFALALGIILFIINVFTHVHESNSYNYR
ncbi:cbb3-type cytochrome c oxidase subunit I [Virgibacillus sp. NKC19-3]|uniref:cbb3-type cytochrome c oxidase subunit I n=1 Tax=Virgibacillus saliphilus TaxID=2831674 RepID=UPI001C9B2763|nr:cbb3-type cytochrome c oxidase subunit I [Virgibacillus sp. NKC19-3]MBY7141639.1 cbb3-type cytochrome c oxidase subunit I [Virgibacillus sp. NKC19-3]